MAKRDNNKLKKHRDKSFSCQATWVKKGTFRSIELVHLKKYCQEREGGYPIDCLLTRTCSSSGENFSSHGVPLFLTKGSIKYLCAAGDHYLYGTEDKKGLKVFIKCKSEIAQAIIIQTPDDKEVKCKLPMRK